jgi:hypothetical protein
LGHGNSSENALGFMIIWDVETVPIPVNELFHKLSRSLVTSLKRESFTGGNEFPIAVTIFQLKSV